MKVKLTYFKPSGKYYSEGEYDIDISSLTIPHLSSIWQDIKCMGELPGISSSYHGSDWIILVEVPDHPHAHPVLLGTPGLRSHEG